MTIRDIHLTPAHTDYDATVTSSLPDAALICADGGCSDGFEHPEGEDPFQQIFEFSLIQPDNEPAEFHCNAEDAEALANYILKKVQDWKTGGQRDLQNGGAK